MLRDNVHDMHVTHMFVQEIARLAEGFSGADLELLCREAAMHGDA
jgi:SpoVK/Ycf46/Vps4 family AAA+-type ATPase